MRLGINNIDINGSCHIKARSGIIKLIFTKYNEFKRRLLKIKTLGQKEVGKVKGLLRIEKAIVNLERILINEKLE